jgi:hypothetical protein
MNAHCQTTAMVYVKIFLEAINARHALTVKNLILRGGVSYRLSNGIFFSVSHSKEKPHANTICNINMIS